MRVYFAKKWILSDTKGLAKMQADLLGIVEPMWDDEQVRISKNVCTMLAYCGILDKLEVVFASRVDPSVCWM